MSTLTVTEFKSQTKTRVKIDRRTLVKALEKIACVIPRASTKPVLLCVRVEATNGLLWLAGTNLDTSLALTLPIAGELPRCLVTCRDLLQRIKASKSPECELWREGDHLVCLEMVSDLCEWHVPPDHLAPQMTSNLKVFKDADALDRWRIADLDPAFLRTKSAHRLLEGSHELWARTHDLDDGDSIFQNIVACADRFGILRD
jgi:hypothetical protein